MYMYIYILLYYIILYYSILYYIILYYITLQYIILYVISYHLISHHIISYHIILYYILLYYHIIISYYIYILTIYIYIDYIYILWYIYIYIYYQYHNPIVNPYSIPICWSLKHIKSLLKSLVMVGFILSQSPRSMALRSPCAGLGLGRDRAWTNGTRKKWWFYRFWTTINGDLLGKMVVSWDLPLL